MAFYGPILGLNPTQGTAGDVVEVTFPPRNPNVFNLTSGIPMRVGFAPSAPGAPGTVIGGHEFQARWTVAGPDTLSVVVPPVGHAGPAAQMPPGNYVINVAQGFDRAHTVSAFRARLPGAAATIAAPASLFSALRRLLALVIRIPVSVVAGILSLIRAWIGRAPILWRAPPPPPPVPTLKRVSTAVPWPRGIVFDRRDGKLIVLARGRPRPDGPLAGDRAGTLFTVDPTVSEDASGPPGADVRGNAQVLAAPASPPFRLWDTAADESSLPSRDIDTDRPYAGLAIEPETRALFVACFSGIDKSDNGFFRKNATDAIHRFDRRDSAWHVVEFHSPANIPEAERRNANTAIPNNYYPNGGPDGTPGLLNGPDGLCVHSSTLYAVAKDNHTLARYNLGDILSDPGAGAPQGAVLHAGDNQGYFDSPSGVAVDAAGEYIYISFRAHTKNAVYRFRLNAGGLGPPQQVARFPDGSGLIDITFDGNGVLYVSAATGAPNNRGAIWKIDSPDPANVFDGGAAAAHITLPSSTAANITVDDQNVLYVCSTARDDPAGLAGVVYRVG